MFAQNFVFLQHSFYVCFSFHNQAAAYHGVSFSPQTVFSLLMCSHRLLWATVKPPLFGCLGGCHYWFPVSQFSKPKPNWAAYISLTRLSHLSLVFLTFISKLSPLSFRLLLTHWCNVLLYFCRCYAWAVSKTQRLKKVESSLDWRSSFDSCSILSSKTFCPLCVSVDLKDHVGFLLAKFSCFYQLSDIWLADW